VEKVAEVNVAGYEIGSGVRTADGFAVGGDAVVVRAGEGNRLVLAVIDVLGHGPEAHEQAVIAEAVLMDSTSFDPVELLAALGTALSGSIGAAASVAAIQADSGNGRFGTRRTSSLPSTTRASRLPSPSQRPNSVSPTAACSATWTPDRRTCAG
jgi:hypothetical protein